MQLGPLGDQAVVAYCPTEDQAFALAARCRAAGWPWLVDVVQAYMSVAVFYDLRRTAYVEAAAAVGALDAALAGASVPLGRRHAIPCCYALGPDLQRVAEHIRRPVEDIIALHSGTVYTVYAIGFCPGFPYLGYLPDALAGVPRLPSPRVRVEAGSVGLTGRQTGIYTEERPGGWNIVGRTPFELVNVADAYFPLRTGDRIAFVPIGLDEYREHCGERLAEPAVEPEA